MADSSHGEQPTANTPEITLMKLVRNFIGDLRPTFPEVATQLASVEQLTQSEFIDNSASIYAESFFHILQKNDELFTPSKKSKSVELLPGVDFSKLWNAQGISDSTREAMWRHLQLIMFELIPLVGNKVPNTPLSLIHI